MHVSLFSPIKTNVCYNTGGRIINDISEHSRDRVFCSWQQCHSAASDCVHQWGAADGSCLSCFAV